MMKTIKGSVVLPPNAPRGTAARLVVEVRDVSHLDAPSTVVARQEQIDVPLEPNGRIDFALTVPQLPSGRSLSVRSHLSIDGSDHVKAGDLLSTASHPLKPHESNEAVAVAVEVV